MTAQFAESEVELAALERFSALGYAVLSAHVRWWWGTPERAQQAQNGVAGEDLLQMPPPVTTQLFVDPKGSFSPQSRWSHVRSIGTGRAIAA